jgi:peptidylprolyl isomerase
LPPKAERRAAAKIAKERRRRAEQRMRILKTAGSALGIIVVIGAIAVACGAFTNKATTSPSASTSASGAPAVSLDPALQTKPTVGAGSGDLTSLKVETIVTGTGPAVKSGQTISVNYVGVSYTTGQEFDASWTGGQPASFQIGAGKVIAGWDQGLVGVKVGSRVQLDIPTDLAYGADAAAQGKPAGPLRFVVDILSAT